MTLSKTYTTADGTFCAACNRIPATHPGGAHDDRAWQGPDGWMARQPSDYFKAHPELWSCKRPAESFGPGAPGPTACEITHDGQCETHGLGYVTTNPAGNYICLEDPTL